MAIPPALRRTFEERYPSPVFSEPRETGIAGLTWVSVFDRSQLAEDPIIPTNWLRAKEAIFATDVEGIRAALAAVGFAPRTSAQAISAAELYRLGQNSTVENPDARREGDVWIVTMDLETRAPRFGGQVFGADSRRRVTITIGADRYQVR